MNIGAWKATVAKRVEHDLVTKQFYLTTLTGNPVYLLSLAVLLRVLHQR